MDEVFAAAVAEFAKIDLTHVDAKSVSDYFWGAEQNAFGPEDYINCAPPWPDFALHFPVPKVVRAANYDTVTLTSYWHNLFRHLSIRHSFCVQVKDMGRHSDGWKILICVIPDTGAAQQATCVFSVILNPDGSVNDYTKTGSGYYKSVVLDPWLRQLHAKSDSDGRELISRNLFTLLDLSLLTITFLHCKNIGLQDVNTPSHRLNKIRKLRRGTAIDSYKVLEISPFRKAAKAANGGSIEPCPQKALHICRGHFKTYTPDKPLLGRSVGTFWFPQHTRGVAQNGSVKKTYKVSDLNDGPNQ